MLVRGLTLDGAWIGVTYFFVPTWEYLLDLQVHTKFIIHHFSWVIGKTSGISNSFETFGKWMVMENQQVWRKAAEQMFYSLSISWGGLILFGSYNDFRNRVHIDALVVSFLDFGTSIIAGVATFSILGAISLETGVDIKEIASSG